MDMIRKTFKFRLYPTHCQVYALNGQLSEACRLYNAAIQERRDAWRIERKSINFYDQARQLKDIRANGDIGLFNFSTGNDVLRRVDKTFKAFFARARRGRRAGFPRFKSQTRYDSLTFPIYGNGCRLLDNGKLRLQGIGLLKVKMHRALEGKLKTVTIKREARRWYVCFNIESEAHPLPENTKAVGIDLGLTAFATLSDGTELENLRWYRKAQKKLRKAQRKAERRKKGSQRRRKAIQFLQGIHAHVRNQRADFHHKLSRLLVNNHGLIVVENLNFRGLSRGMLAKSINDAGWSSFVTKLSYKAVEAGRQLIKVDPRGTSQKCLCGADVPKTLRERWHECECCGLSAPRDYVSAQLILRLGLSLRAPTWSAETSVAREAVCFS